MGGGCARGTAGGCPRGAGGGFAGGGCAGGNCFDATGDGCAPFAPLSTDFGMLSDRRAPGLAFAGTSNMSLRPFSRKMESFCPGTTPAGIRTCTTSVAATPFDGGLGSGRGRFAGRDRTGSNDFTGSKR